MPAPTRIEKGDIAVAHAAATVHETPLVRALGFVSELADQPPLIAICAATFAAGLLARNRRLASAGGRMLAAELLATKLKSLVKHRIDRTRPSVLASGGSYQARPGDDTDHAMNSFPSGHTAGAVAVARAFAREYPGNRVGAYTAAAAVGAIQIPRCTHYPSDIGAGAIVGIVAEEAVHLAEKIVRRAAR